MRVAVMQPYFFPYFGYFQLINAVDRFVVLDDVSYVNKGWINRNRILVNGRGHRFAVPLKSASQNTLIKDIELAVDDRWKRKFLRSIERSYRNAPFFATIFPLVEDTISIDTKLIIEWNLAALLAVTRYLEIETDIIETSTGYHNNELKGQSRILDICRREGATRYLNTIAGEELYCANAFEKRGIQLHFLQMADITYHQFGDEFVPWLSIIDVMMFNSRSEIQGFLTEIPPI